MKIRRRKVLVFLGLVLSACLTSALPSLTSLIRIVNASPSVSSGWAYTGWHYRKEHNITGTLQGTGVSSEWAYEGWLYRKEHNITGSSAGSQTNYQVEIVAHYGSGTDSGNTFYMSGRSKEDFGDLRFSWYNYSSSSEVKLELNSNSGNYSIRELYSGDNATIGVKLPEISNIAANTIYVYYGKADASSSTNGLNTFIRWDDFDLGYIVNDDPKAERGWTFGGDYPDDVYIANNPDGSGKVCLMYESDYLGILWLRNTFGTTFSSVAVHFKWRFGNQDEYRVVRGQEGGSSRVLIRRNAGGSTQWHDGSGFQDFSPTLTLDLQKWYDLEFRVKDTGTDYVKLVDENGTVHTGDWFATPTTGIDHWRWDEDGSFMNIQYIDDYFVRKYVDPEPSHGPWGLEEGGLLTDYQMEIVTHYSSGTDSGENVYLNSKGRTDFGDLRFSWYNYTANQEVKLELNSNSGNYSIRELHSGDNATFWLNIPEITLPIDSTIYVYYGRNDATSISNGLNTFIRWDDFDLGYVVGNNPKSERGWSVVGEGDSDEAKIVSNPDGSGKVCRIHEGGIWAGELHLVNDFPATYSSVAIGFKQRYGNQDQFRTWIGYEVSFVRITIKRQTSGTVQWFDNAIYHDFDPSFNLNLLKWYDLEFLVRDTGTDYVKIVDDNGTVHTGDWRTTPTTGISRWDWTQYLGADSEQWIDDFYVRKYYDPEPSHDAWGSEEEKNSAPTNDACNSDATFDVNVYGWVNMTVSDGDGINDLKTVEIQITTSDSKTFTLRWTQSSNLFSEISDPSGICTLDVSGSIRVNIDFDTDKIAFLFKIGPAAQKGACSVQATTKDDLDATDQDNYPSEFSINFYIEITVNDAIHGWTGLHAGDSDILVNSGGGSDGDIDLTITANGQFTLQAKGSGALSSDGDTIPLGNVKIHATTLESATSLKTTYENIGGLTNEARGVDLAKSFKLWITVPDPQPYGTYTYTLYVRGV